MLVFKGITFVKCVKKSFIYFYFNIQLFCNTYERRNKIITNKGAKEDIAVKNFSAYKEQEISSGAVLENRFSCWEGELE